jgi:hypothetical protein
MGKGYRMHERRLRIGSLLFVISFFLAVLPHIVEAQEGKFLGDKHQAKGLNCSACHKESPPKEAVKSETCLKCHGDAEKLAMKTAAVRPNPHDSHLGDAACEQCHHSHKPSEDACSKCHHFGFKVP